MTAQQSSGSMKLGTIWYMDAKVVYFYFGMYAYVVPRSALVKREHSLFKDFYHLKEGVQATRLICNPDERFVGKIFVYEKALT